MRRNPTKDSTSRFRDAFAAARRRLDYLDCCEEIEASHPDGPPTDADVNDPAPGNTMSPLKAPARARRGSVNTP